MEVHGIPVDASVRMDNRFMDSIEPFDYSALVPFSLAYFTGHLADKYDVDVKKALPRADYRLAASVRWILATTVKDYTRVSPDGAPLIHKEEGNVRYAMLPVWILTTNYKGKPYTFMMNGQTGKVVSSALPRDVFKERYYPLVPAVLVFLIVCWIGQMILDW